MSVPDRTTDGKATWILQRSLEFVVLPEWLQEAAKLLSEVAEGDMVYVASKLDEIQLQAGAEHVRKKIVIRVDPHACRGVKAPYQEVHPVQELSLEDALRMKRVDLRKLTPYEE